MGTNPIPIVSLLVAPQLVSAPDFLPLALSAASESLLSVVPAATSSETTLSNSSHPSKRSGSPPSIAAVPPGGWLPSIQTRMSAAAAPQRFIDRHRRSFPWKILTALVAFIWGARLFRLGTDGLNAPR